MLEEAFIKELPQLSVAVVAILVIVWFASQSQKAYNSREEKHDKTVKELQDMMCSERKQFVAYIDEHNHVFTDLVKECTTSITCATENMKHNTSILQEVSEILRSLKKYN